MDMADQPNERAKAVRTIMFNVNWNSLLFSAALSGGLSILIPRRESFAHMPPRGGTSSFT